MKRLAGLLALAVLAGCESEANKLTRLRSEQNATCFAAAADYKAFQDVADSIRKDGLLGASVKLRQAGDTVRANKIDAAYEARDTALHASAKGAKWQASKAACDLATRDVDRMLK